MSYKKLLKVLLLVVFPIICIAATAQRAGAAELKVGSDAKILVYYFHGKARCVTCMKIEELTAEAVKDTFGADHAQNRVVYKSVNVDEAENEHFIADFQLMVKSVVIAKEVDGKEVAWKRLDKVWQYYTDPKEFFAYFTANAQKILEER